MVQLWIYVKHISVSRTLIVHLGVWRISRRSPVPAGVVHHAWVIAVVDWASLQNDSVAGDLYDLRYATDGKITMNTPCVRDDKVRSKVDDKRSHNEHAYSHCGRCIPFRLG